MVERGAFVLLVTAWLVTLPGLRWYANPDGVSYLSLAERWVIGDVATAVNGYWSPLYSWLLAPLLAVGVPPLLAARAVLLLAALLALLALRRLLLAADVSPRSRGVVLLTAVPLLVLMSGWGLYPDLLAVAVLLEALHQLTAPGFRHGLRAPLLAGLLGGAAFLTKAFALAYFPALLVVVGLLHLRSRSRPTTVRLLRASLVAGGAFAVVAVSWIGVLSATYGELTVSTAGEFNAELIGSDGHGFQQPGLYPVPHPEATSAWEVPPELGVVEDADPDPDLGSGSGSPDVLDRLERVGEGLADAVASGARRVTVPALVALFALPVLVRRGRFDDATVVRLGVLAAGALLVGGYALVFVIERYLWFGMLALLVLTGVGLDRLRSRPVRSAVVAALLLVTTLGVVNRLAPRWGEHRDVHVVAARLDGLDGGIALADGDWSHALLLAYLEDTTFHGTTGPLPRPVLVRELQQADVAHLVVLREAVRPPGLEPLNQPLRVYDVTSDSLEPRLAADQLPDSR